MKAKSRIAGTGCVELGPHAVIVLAQEVDHQPDEADRDWDERDGGDMNEPRLGGPRASGAKEPDPTEGGAQIAWMVDQLRSPPTEPPGL